MENLENLTFDELLKVLREKVKGCDGRKKSWSYWQNSHRYENQKSHN